MTRLLLVCSLVAGVLSSAGSAQLVFAPYDLFAAAHQAGPLAAGDVDGDGHADLLAGDAVASGAISVLLNQGDGTFVSDPPFFAPGPVRQIELARLDADPHLDVVVVVETANTYRVLVARGTGSGTFGAAAEVWRQLKSRPHVAIGDVTGDGQRDLVVATSPFGIPADPARLDLVIGAGDGTFAPPVTLETAGTNTMEDVTVGDFDGDDIDDIVVARTADHLVRVHISQPGGGIASSSDHVVSFFPALVRVGDIDDDGALDIVTSTDDSSAEIGLVTFRGTGDGSFGPAQTSIVPPGVFVQDIDVAHADDDTYPDLFASSANVISGQSFNLGLLALRGVGDGTFTKGKLASVPDFGFDLVRADFDGDGLDDAALGSVPFMGQVNVRVVINRTYRAGDPFTDLGSDLPGGSTYPILLADGALVPGETVSFAVRLATLGADAYLVVGSSRLLLPFGGGTMVPAPDVVVGPLVVPGGGDLDFSGPWPSGVPAGFRFYTQVWFEDVGGPAGWSATSAVRTTAP